MESPNFLEKLFSPKTTKKPSNKSPSTIKRRTNEVNRGYLTIPRKSIFSKKINPIGGKQKTRRNKTKFTRKNK